MTDSAQTAGNARPGVTAPRATWLVWLFLLGVAFIFGGMILLLVGLVSGQIMGQEFSPDLFQRRNFHFIQVPVVHVMAFPITRTDNTGQLETYLKQHKYINPTNVKTARWDLVYQSGVDPAAANCDARLLCEYLDNLDANNDLFWHKWTEDHPELAKRFWPIIAKLARQGNYVLLPELFDRALRLSSAPALEEDLHSYLNEQFRRRADAEQQRANHQRAVDAYSEALVYDPEDPVALRGRATSYGELGQHNKSRADLADAKRHTQRSSHAE
jgi:hypothetical protein